MGSNNKLKEIEIKICGCYYFDHIVDITNFDPDFIG